MESIGQRLKKLQVRLEDKALYKGEGLGNEVNFHIFDYDPEHEPTVSAFLPVLKRHLNQAPHNLEVLEINLYDLTLEILSGRDLLERTFALETQKSSEALKEAINNVVRPETILEQIRDHLKHPHNLVFLTGIGSAWPLIRSHNILNNLHPIVEKPLLMFFPGNYNGHSLELFGAFKDDNYYRAFAIVPRQEFRGETR